MSRFSPPRRAFAFLLALATALAGPATAATFTVTSTANHHDVMPGDGICATGASTCTLRAALQEANASQGSHTINFNIPGVGPHIISSPTELPVISRPVAINGYSQPGASANTLAVGNNAQIRIHLRAPLSFNQGASGSSLRGMALYPAGSKAIEILNAHGITIAGNFIGTDGSGTGADATGGLAVLNGIVINGDAGSTTGNTVGGAQPADRNLILGKGAAVSIGNDSGTGGNTKNTMVRGNYIGTDRTGKKLVSAHTGIAVVGGQNSQILDNVIGSTQTGIHVVGAAHGTNIQGNRIGVGADDVTAITSVASFPLVGQWGISIQDHALGAPQHVHIGGPIASQGNHIAHWSMFGIQIQRRIAASPDLLGHTFRGNRIHSNGMLGIKFIDLATQEHGHPAGPPPMHINGGLHAPAIVNATGNASGTQVGWQLSGMPSGGMYELEVFANTACTDDGYGPGRFPLGSGFASVNANGQASGTLNLPARPQGSNIITMTVTHHLNGAFSQTSSFSACRTINTAPGTPPILNLPPQAELIASINQPFPLNLSTYTVATEGDTFFYAAYGVPPGLALVTHGSSQGRFTGVPTAPGSYLMSVTAVDKDGASAPIRFTLTVIADTPPASLLFSDDFESPAQNRNAGDADARANADHAGGAAGLASHDDAGARREGDAATASEDGSARAKDHGGPHMIPATSPFALLVLALLLGVVGWRVRNA